MENRTRVTGEDLPEEVTMKLRSPDKQEVGQGGGSKTPGGKG